jgi:hypothetical protein
MGTVVLTIDRNEFGPRLSDGFHNNTAAGDENLFVGQPYALPGPDCLISGRQTCHPDYRRHNKIDFPGRTNCYSRCRLTPKFGPILPRQASRNQAFSQSIQRRRIFDNGCVRTKFQNLRTQQIHIFAGHQGINRKPLPVLPHYV